MRENESHSRSVFHVAMDLLARREHSAFELSHKLRKRDFLENEIVEAINHLQHKGLQSDVRFTEAYIAMRKRRGFGPVRIRQELQERGIVEEVIESFLLINKLDWGILAKGVREKRFGVRVPTEYREKAKQKQFLEYRGFTLEQIKRATKDD